jgi:hypothetical protein
MEHLDGMTLAELLEQQRTPPLARVVDILRQTCAAVDEAHRHGIVHRDLKPENIWLRPRPRGGYEVKVLDFGIAMLHGAHGGAAPALDTAADPDAEPTSLPAVDPDAATQAEPPSHPPVSTTLPSISGPPSSPDRTLADPPAASATLDEGGRASGAPSSIPRAAEDGKAPPRITQFGTVLGTPLYMPPEQWLHREVDARSDIYSLGIIAYRMIAGRVPFDGRSTSISMQHVREAPVPLSKAAPGTPAPVEAAVMAALAKKPAERPASAQSFATALAAGAEGTASMLLRATALAATQFPGFLRVTATVFGPALVACVLRLTSRLLVNAGLVPVEVGAAFGMVCYVVYYLSVALLQPVVAAMIAPRARDAMLAPEEPPRSRPTTAEIVEGFRRTLPATLVVVLCAGAIGMLTQPPVLWAVRYFGVLLDLKADFTPIERTVLVVMELPGVLLYSLLAGRWFAFPSVVSMERVYGLRALRRSAALTRPFRTLSVWIVLLHFGVRHISVWAVWLSIGQIARVPFGWLIQSRADSVVHDAALVVIMAALVVGWTFTFTMMAVLYFAGRQAEGVTLEAMVRPASTPPPPAPAAKAA